MQMAISCRPIPLPLHDIHLHLMTVLHSSTQLNSCWLISSSNTKRCQHPISLFAWPVGCWHEETWNFQPLSFSCFEMFMTLSMPSRMGLHHGSATQFHQIQCWWPALVDETKVRGVVPWPRHHDTEYSGQSWLCVSLWYCTVHCKRSWGQETLDWVHEWAVCLAMKCK